MTIVRAMMPDESSLAGSENAATNGGVAGQASSPARDRVRLVRKLSISATEKEAGKYNGLSREELISALLERDSADQGGVRLTYTGQAPPWHIVRRVKPRRQKIEKRLCIGGEESQAANLLMEGENLQGMVSLFKYRGQVDLIVTDPPYNTGQDFRYNDKWDQDPNDPDLGALVPKDDGSRHTKWLRFMTPRLWMMKEMLKPSGVIAIFIGDDELFRLGVLMDEIFGESNRLAVINWQKIYSSKQQPKHVAKATEYILVYEKVEKRARREGAVASTGRRQGKVKNVDNDPEGPWVADNPTGREGRKKTDYGLQSPDDGHMWYPPANRHWAYEKASLKKWIEEWGVRYEEIEDPNCHSKSLVIKGSYIKNKAVYTPRKVLAAAKGAAKKTRGGVWPFLFFAKGGAGRPMVKLYRDRIDRGEVPMTFWAHEEFDRPIEMGSVSWPHQNTGTGKRGTIELQQVLGDVNFETVKPLELIEKLIHLWCPKDGIVFDPFAGSGTTAHAVLRLNQDTEAHRRFILIEQGRPDRGDPYARALTQQRIERAITGKWAAGAKKPLPGGFRFTQLTKTVDAEALLALEREEMVDLLLTTHWDQSERSASFLRRLPAGTRNFLFAANQRGEGYFLVWSGPNNPAVLDRAAFRAIAQEAEAEGLKAPYHVYARISTYSGPNIEFYQIPDRILEKLGFNQATEPYMSEPRNGS